MYAKLPLIKVVLLENWDPVGGDIFWHNHASGKKESIEGCKFQAATLAIQKASQKQNGFFYSDHPSVKALVEKNMEGPWCKSGGSFYTWVHACEG